MCVAARLLDDDTWQRHGTRIRLCFFIGFVSLTVWVRSSELRSAHGSVLAREHVHSCVIAVCVCVCVFVRGRLLSVSSQSVM